MENVIVPVPSSASRVRRAVRGNTLALKHLTYVEAARSLGASATLDRAAAIFPERSRVVVYFFVRIGTSSSPPRAVSFSAGCTAAHTGMGCDADRRAPNADAR